MNIHILEPLADRTIDLGYRAGFGTAIAATWRHRG